MMQVKALLLSGIRAPFDAPEGEIIKIAKAKMKRACIFAAGLHFRLYKKSFDARHKGDIKQVCSVLVSSDVPLRLDEKTLARLGARPFTQEMPAVVHGTARAAARPLVVGMGPAGLFAALLQREEITASDLESIQTMIQHKLA